MVVEVIHQQQYQHERTRTAHHFHHFRHFHIDSDSDRHDYDDHDTPRIARSVFCTPPQPRRTNNQPTNQPTTNNNKQQQTNNEIPMNERTHAPTDERTDELPRAIVEVERHCVVTMSQSMESKRIQSVMEDCGDTTPRHATQL